MGLEAPLPDEVEAYMVLQECLEMRKRYVFTEAVAPWEKEVISDPGTPKPNPEPFFYALEGKSDVSILLSFSSEYMVILKLYTLCEEMNVVSAVMQHYFEMQDGVVHVYPNIDCKCWEFVFVFCNYYFIVPF